MKASPSLSSLRKGIGFLSRHVWIQYVVVFFVAAVFFWSIQFSIPTFSEYDAYYHVKVASLMKERGLLHEFPWMKYSIFTDKFYDLHLGSHLLLLPFVSIGDDVLWGKIAAVLFSSLVVMVFFWILWQLGVKNAILWSFLMMAGSEIFVIRLTMVRLSIHLSIILSLLAFYLIVKERALALGVVSFVYTLCYSLFAVTFAFSLVYFAVQWLVEKKRNYQMMIASFAGIVLGLVVNPYFPLNLSFLTTRIYHMGLGNNLPIENVEWLPIGFTEFSTIHYWFLLLSAFCLVMIFFNILSQKYKISCLVVILLSSFLVLFHTLYPSILPPQIFLMIAIGILLYSIVMIVLHRNMILFNSTLLFSFTLAMAFLYFQFQYVRVAEYFVPFGFLFVSLFTEQNLRKINGMSRFFFMGLAIILLFSLLQTHQQSTRDIAFLSDVSLKHMESCGVWLKDHTPSGSHVFVADWAQMSPLFYYDANNIYTIGLDLQYLYYFNMSLFWEYTDIMDGKKGAILSMREDFDVDYVFLEKNQLAGPFGRQISSLPSIKEEYHDQGCIIYGFD